ncbi:hypothetical protein ACFL23_00135 [Patescibacteria group bacterium]
MNTKITYNIFINLINKKDMQIIKCPNCKYEGNGKKITKGSFLMELFLWILFFPVGIIYSLWRVNSRHIGCPKCGYNYVIIQ